MYWIQKEKDYQKRSEQLHEGDGLIERRALFKTESRLPINMEIWELNPGVSEGDHIHGKERPLEEIYYFLKGEGKMTINGKEISVSKGDAIMIPPGVDHGLFNNGEKTLKLVIIWGNEI